MGETKTIFYLFLKKADEAVKRNQKCHFFEKQIKSSKSNLKRFSLLKRRQVFQKAEEEVVWKITPLSSTQYYFLLVAILFLLSLLLRLAGGVAPIIVLVVLSFSSTIIIVLGCCV